MLRSYRRHRKRGRYASARDDVVDFEPVAPVVEEFRFAGCDIDRSEYQTGVLTLVQLVYVDQLAKRSTQRFQTVDTCTKQRCQQIFLAQPIHSRIAECREALLYLARYQRSE